MSEISNTSKGSWNKQSALMVDDLVNGSLEWRNIEDIIRLTFRAVSEVLKEHSQSLHLLEQEVPSRASKQELAQTLSHKANVHDIQKTINYL